MFRLIISKAEQNPKKLFLFDGLGAILSVFLLGVVLVEYKTLVGIPSNVLYTLAAIPMFFVVYDAYCYFKLDSNIGTFLKSIAILNSAYCLLSLSLVFYHLETTTIYGWAYILIEILIVLFIAIIEYKVGKRYCN